MIALTVGVPLLVALPAASWPVAVSLGTAGAAVVAAGAYAPLVFRRIYAWSLGGLLLGYAFLGRGFAYLNVAGVHVGEVVLLLGLVTLFVVGKRWRFATSPVPMFILLFAAWGAARTLPYVQEYGLDAARDGVIWGYAVFAFYVYYFVSTRRDLETLIWWYGRITLVFLLWVIVAGPFSRFNLAAIPRLPGQETPLLFLKPSDIAVHLAGLAAFAASGLGGTTKLGLSSSRSAGRWLWWVGWVAAALVVSNGRGGMVALGCAFLLLIALRPPAGWVKLATAGAFSVLVLASLGSELDFGDPRPLSSSHLSKYAASVFSGQGDQDLDGSRTWRLLWWREILDYSLSGPYFWAGKGFGINLADDDGFQVTDDSSLRSPHNGHLTILARTGVPGFALWVGILVAFVVAMVHVARHAAAHGERWWAGVTAWILVLWVGMAVNASFDVYLEGPQGGIWFWSLTGLGLAAVRVYWSDQGPACRDLPGTPFSTGNRSVGQVA